LTELVAFDRFTINRHERRLYAGGTPVAVSSAGLRLLVALVDRHGQVVTKDELITQVWGSSPITENALHVQVAALRRLIGNHLIITQSGVGYRFVGELKPLGPKPRAGPAAKAARTGGRELLGRESQLRDLVKALGRHRLLTLTGPGGVGKTTLARALCQAVASDFADGVWFVELAAQREQAAVIDSVKAALGAEGRFDAVPLQDVLARLQSKQALLVLDNCEHLLPGVSRLAEALHAGAPGLAILATSRQALGCHGEHVVIVPPLGVPDPGVDGLRAARRSPAFRLFTDRIAALDPDFVVQEDQAAVAARICRSLDSLPLALEIVASWASVLGLETLEAKLSAAPIAWAHSRLTAPARHYDLRTALGWSHDLLSPPERAVLRRIAVFAHEFTLAAAEPVAAGEHLHINDVFTHLATLVQKSLVVVTPHKRPPAYRLLETTRAFALEKLREAGEEEQARAKHAASLLDLLLGAEPAWDRAGSATWLSGYAGLIPELRSALDWAVVKGGDLPTGTAIAAASWPLWRELSLRVEGARWLEAALKTMPAATAPAVEAQLRFGVAMMHCDSNWHVARAAFMAAAALYRQLGDRHRLGWALQHLAFTEFLLGDANAAEALSDEARGLLDGYGSQRALAVVYVIQLVLLSHRGQYDAARAAGQQAVRLYEAIGAERAAFTARSNLLDVALCKDDLETAIAEGSSLAASLRATSHGGVLGFVLVNLMAALVRAARFAEALDTAREAAQVLPGHRPLFVLLDHLALRCAMMGRMEEAAMLVGFTDRAYGDRGWPRQHVEEATRARLQLLLRAALAAPVMDRRMQDGMQLSEAGAWAIAARNEQEGQASNVASSR
jgi:predicted ATPase/DNA-binding winged helix-turn-helix (wHTH) protein